MKKKDLLVIIGAGGFGQEIVWAANNMNGLRDRFQVIGYCDDDSAKKGAEVYGTKVLGTPEEAAKSLQAKAYFLCAIGDNAVRINAAKRALALGWEPTTIIDPSVIRAEFICVGAGTYIGAGSILSPYAQIGQHVIINHHCSIGHDSRLEDFVQVSPGCRISGSCRIKTGATLGSNAVVAPGRMIGRMATLGACSFAVTDIGDNITAIGNPARAIMQRRPEQA